MRAGASDRSPVPFLMLDGMGWFREVQAAGLRAGLADDGVISSWGGHSHVRYIGVFRNGHVLRGDGRANMMGHARIVDFLFRCLMWNS